MEALTIGQLNNEVPIFSKYYSLYPLRLAEIFGDSVGDNIDTFDTLLTDTIGDRILTGTYRNAYDKIGANGLTELLCKELDLMRFNTWVTIRDAVTVGYRTDIATPLHEVKERAYEENTNGNRFTQNQENAFDDTENASNTSNVDSRNNNKSIIAEQVTTKRSNASALPIDVANKVIDFATTISIARYIILDIAKFSCLDIL